MDSLFAFADNLASDLQVLKYALEDRDALPELRDSLQAAFDEILVCAPAIKGIDTKERQGDG